MNATDAQIRYLKAWRKSHDAELKEIALSHGIDLRNKAIHELASTEANTIIASMVANYGEPTEGKDSENHHEDPEHRDDNERNENEGDTTDGEGEGSGDGDGDGDGKGEGKNPYREGSKEQIIADALMENDLDNLAAYEDLKDLIGEEPLVFKGNKNGKREPLPIGSDYDRTSERTQKGRAKKTINDVRNDLIKNHDKRPGDRFEKDEKEEGTPETTPDGNGNGGGSDSTPLHELEALLAQINRAREICEQMNADGEPFDTVGMRPYVHAPKMYHAGFSRLAIMDMMTMSWPKEVRRDLNGGADLPSFDQTGHDPNAEVALMPVEEIEKRLAPLAEKTNGKSLYLPALVSLAQINVPILQVGEKGTGKTTNAEHLAEALAEIYGCDMPFGFASMTSGTSPGEFKGRITLDGFLPSQFEGIYENGGVFLFDELDAGDENLLTLLNSALANGQFVNQKGQIIRQSEMFVPIAAANTMGLGATARYTGRNRLDAATLDRWNMGRIRVDFNQDLAEYIFWKGALNSMNKEVA